MHVPPETRPALLADIEKVVEIHFKSLRDDVLPNLGENFLRKFYAKLLNSSSQSLILALNQNDVIGFVAISFENINLIEQATFSDYLTLAGNCLLRPYLPFSALLQSRRNINAPDSSSAEISFIAVDSSARGSGVGKKLIEVAGIKAKQAGKQFLKTKTSNLPFANFYKKNLGAETVDQYRIFSNQYMILKWRV